MKKSNIYCSNCLVEALKAKLSNWKDTRLIVFLPSYSGSLHFGWSDGKSDYWFMSIDPTDGLVDTLYHKGTIEKFKLGTFDRLKRIQKLENLKKS